MAVARATPGSWALPEAFSSHYGQETHPYRDVTLYAVSAFLRQRKENRNHLFDVEFKKAAWDWDALVHNFGDLGLF